MPLGLFAAIYAEEIILFYSARSEAALFLRLFGMAAFLRPTLEPSGLLLFTCGLSSQGDCGDSVRRDGSCRMAYRGKR
jgi:hypothetical protein